MKTKGGGSFFLVFAVVLALVAGFLVMQVVRSAAPTVPVLVAAADMQPGERLTEDKLAVVDFPAAAVPPDPVTGDTLDGVIGYHTKTALAAGIPIQNSYVAELSPSGGTLAARVALAGENLRGLALPPEASAGLVLEPGDRVDVISVTQAAQDQPPKAETVLQSVPVVMVNIDPDGKQIGIVVGVSPEQAEAAALAAATAQVRVTVVPVQQYE